MHSRLFGRSINGGHFAGGGVGGSCPQDKSWKKEEKETNERKNEKDVWLKEWWRRKRTDQDEGECE